MYIHYRLMNETLVIWSTNISSKSMKIFSKYVLNLFENLCVFSTFSPSY